MTTEFRSIAVAVDGSPHADDALATAIDMARRYSASLTVVAVAPLPAAFVLPNEPAPAPVMESDTPRFRALVDAGVERARAAGLAAVEGVCEEGPPVDTILDFLRAHPVDLLVVGSRGLSTAKRILLGSVSAGLVNHAPCPVLVVRPKVTTP
ncbi:MAG TPA: universal stress protein [Thermoplasmata archaeon]|nr:universal stress protein [Thermoplasmata archaeon]